MVAVPLQWGAVPVDTTGDGVADTTGYDVDGDGIADVIADPNNPGQYLQLSVTALPALLVSKDVQGEESEDGTLY